jgi:hypothetical protein
MMGTGAMAAVAQLLLFAAVTPAQQGRVVFESSDKRLAAGFQWAKRQALAYVFHGDPVGDWYEAALPNRNAFCMRDVSHQSTGAQVLGLAPFTANMLRKFALHIADSRDWCTFWEIDKWDRPAPVDYTGDSDFWYCLPANFDILSCCYRQYLATGNRAYLEDPVFLNFYRRTVSDYIGRWDKDGDGIPESYRNYGRRGIGSYAEDLELHARVGGDLVAAEFAAFEANARIEELRGDASAAAEYQRKAGLLRAQYNGKWWDAKKDRFYTSLLQDGSFYERDPVSPFDLWFGIPQDGLRTERALDRLLGQSAAGVEELSYVPEIAYRYGRNAAGYAALMRLTDPKLERREYPEISFAVVGAIATGTMGIRPDAAGKMVETLPRLTPETAWAEVRHLPALGNQIGVRHWGTGETQFTNESGPPIQWKAAFPGQMEALLVDGRRVVKLTAHGGQAESYAILTVPERQTRRVRVLR